MFIVWFKFWNPGPYICLMTVCPLGKKLVPGLEWLLVSGYHFLEIQNNIHYTYWYILFDLRLKSWMNCWSSTVHLTRKFDSNLLLFKRVKKLKNTLVEVARTIFQTDKCGDPSTQLILSLHFTFHSGKGERWKCTWAK